MKELGLLFQTDMALANVEGRKTMTRRVVKVYDAMGRRISITHPTNQFVDLGDGDYCWETPGGTTFGYRCPYGQPGDLIYQKETWKPGAWREDGRVAFDYRASPELINTPWCQCPDGETMEMLMGKWCDQLDKAGLREDEDGMYHWEPGKSPLPWNASMFMPKWAARFWAEIVSVRVERVQEISEEDALREGIILRGMSRYQGEVRDEYRILWERINGPGSWEANPWVWVIGYKQVTR